MKFQKRQWQRWREVGLWCAIILLPAGAVLAVSQSKKRQERAGCATCAELGRSKQLFEAGKLSQADWIARRLNAVDEDWHRYRRPLLLEKEKLLAAQQDAGKGSFGDLLETRLEIARTKKALKNLSDVEYEKTRGDLLVAYRKWLDEKVTAGSMNSEEREIRLSGVQKKP